MGINSGGSSGGSPLMEEVAIMVEDRVVMVEGGSGG